jgi:RHS repeat-associated protein
VQADQTAQDFAGAASTVSISYIQVDHLNTPRVITDPAGNLVWTWDNTEPFGDSVPDENPSGLGIFQFDLGFPGQVRNRETGTFYNYFRDCYDPATGRYCESDPIGLRGGLNSYLYVLADPLRSMDPFGLIQIFELDGVTFHAYPGAPAGGTEHARWGEGESYHVHLKTADGQEVRYSTENWKPLTDDDAARATKAHKRAVDSLTDGEKKLLDRTNREVFHKGRPTLQQILRIGTVRGMRAGIICRPGSE